MAVELFDYLESRDDADELIQEFGAAASVRRSTNSGTAFDPTVSTTDYSTLAAKIEFTWKQVQVGALSSNTNQVLENDERWLVAAGPLGAISILPGDALVIGGAVKPVLKVDTLAPAGTVVMFDCHIRV